jgi:O-antigen/teichoic acid export membrane protein
LRLLVGYGLPLLGAGLLAGPVINTGIPALLALVVSTQDVARYSTALALQTAVYLPISVVEQAILPRWAWSAGPSVEGFRAITRWSLLAASMPFAVLWLVPGDALELVYGARYRSSGILVMMTAASALFGAAVGPNEAALKAAGDTRWVFSARVIAAVCGLAVAAATVHVWGAIGAVAGFSTAAVLVNALYAVRLWRRQAVQPIARDYLRSVAAILVSLLVAHVLVERVPETPLLRLLAAGSAYVGALLLSLLALGSDDPRRAIDGLRALRARLVAA